MHVKEKFEM